MREGDSKEGDKGTIPESDAESVLDAIGQMQETGTFDSTRLPKDPVIRKRLDEILVTIRAVQDFALCISKGDLDCRLEAKGVSAGSLKFLHSNLRHLTWQAQQIAAGDFSQRVDFMGEFSEAFNHMVMALDAARAEMKQRERELSSLNAQLLTEVTVRKQAEEHLDQQFRFLQRLTDTIPNPIFYKDANGVYTGCNTAFEKYLGLPKDQIAGKSVYDISPKELADKYFAKDKELFDHPGTQIYESRVKYADGSIHDVIFNKATFSDLQGNVQGLVGVIVDITERKKAEAAILQSEQKFRDIFNNTTDAIHIHGIRDDGTPGRFTEVNDVTCRILGYTKEEMLAKTPLDIATNYHNPPIEKILEEQRTTGNSRFETEYRRKDGTIIPVEVNTHVVTIQGRKVMLGVVRDITERKKADALLKHFNEELEQEVKVRTEELNASLDEKVILLREVHHRVKNNLQIIISLVNLQMRQIDDERLKQVMAETQNRVRAMSFVHEKLFQSADISHIDLANYTRFLVTQLFSFYRIDSRQVTLDVDIGKIMLDINTAIPLGLIINELASNTLKHAFPNGRTGSMSITVREVDKTLSITVKDDGIGIPADFDWRHAESLGLQLVISLVEQLDGTIELDRSTGNLFTIIVHEKE